MREFLPAPQANLVNLVINKENWGVYVNLQPIDSVFQKTQFGNDAGNRYKGRKSFKYLGTNPQSYTAAMPLVSRSTPTAYLDLIKATATMVIRPLAKREVELPKLIDLDLAHRHLAANWVVGNNDSLPRHNYYIYTDPFHEQLALVPWDLNISLWQFGVRGPPAFLRDTDLWRRRFEGHVRLY